ncbi:hypothetical protein [Paenibacillus sp. FSL R10-2771]|jgi:hypothetical protein
MKAINVEPGHPVKIPVNNLSPELLLRMLAEVEQAKQKGEKKVG